MASPLHKMDDLTISWLKIACLLATAFIQVCVIAWIWVCIKEANKVSKPADDADDLETDQLPDRDDVDELQPTPVQQHKTWVAEIIQPKGENKTPCYYFHCPAYDGNGKPGIYRGKCYLYTPTGNAFVTTENPTTAILLQQLLNDGQLTVKPFTTETQ